MSLKIQLDPCSHAEESRHKYTESGTQHQSWMPSSHKFECLIGFLLLDISKTHETSAKNDTRTWTSSWKWLGTSQILYFQSHMFRNWKRDSHHFTYLWFYPMAGQRPAWKHLNRPSLPYLFSIFPYFHLPFWSLWDLANITSHQGYSLNSHLCYI